MAEIVLYLYIFIVGAVIGSFLNVVIWRVPRGLSVAKGRSMCPSCGHTLRAADLVPVFSWLFLRGKCRYCGAPISPRYAAVELLGGGLALLCALRFGLTPAALAYFAFLCVLVCLSFIDADTMEFPGVLLWTLAGLAAACALADPAETLLSRGIGFLCVSAPMFLLTLLIPDCFGGGDVKLIAVCGFVLGWRRTLLCAFIAVVLGGIYGAALLLRRKKGRQDRFAFGPFIGVGAAAALLWGNEIIAAYLGAFGIR
ncbi:MAG: prepilin peptidase [Oscillospiraceae bacterium]|nr:prepilin peptidase [Oscillospiraceae bacterium]